MFNLKRSEIGPKGFKKHPVPFLMAFGPPHQKAVLSAQYLFDGYGNAGFHQMGGEGHGIRAEKINASRDDGEGRKALKVFFRGEDPGKT